LIKILNNFIAFFLCYLVFLHTSLYKFIVENLKTLRCGCCIFFIRSHSLEVLKICVFAFDLFKVCLCHTVCRKVTQHGLLQLHGRVFKCLRILIVFQILFFSDFVFRTKNMFIRYVLIRAFLDLSSEVIVSCTSCYNDLDREHA